MEYTKENVHEAERCFDTFIVGSDQVWNPTWYDSAYMLDFIEDKKKIAYSASMGVSTLTDEQKDLFRSHLLRFNAISVRENEASATISSILETEVDVTVDPTLLLSSAEWDEISSERKVEEKYIFLYLLGENSVVRRIAERFAQKKSMKLVFIPDVLGLYRHSDRKIKGEQLLDVTPNDFISLIKHAEYIITDSFHACVFSILYKKNFFVFERGGKNRMESRIYSLTNLFECSERFCDETSKCSCDYLLSLPPVNYMKIPVQFIEKKKMSIEYLEKNLM